MNNLTLFTLFAILALVANSHARDSSFERDANSSLQARRNLGWSIGCEHHGSGSNEDVDVFSSWVGIASAVVGEMAGSVPGAGIIISIFENIPWLGNSNPDDYLNDLDDCILDMINQRIEAHELEDAKELLKLQSIKLARFDDTFINKPLSEASIDMADRDLADMEDFVDQLMMKFTSDSEDFKHENFFDMVVDGLVTESLARIAFVKIVLEGFNDQKASELAADQEIRLESRIDTMLKGDGFFSIPKVMADSAFHLKWPGKIVKSQGKCTPHYTPYYYCEGNNNCNVVDTYRNLKLGEEKHDCTNGCGNSNTPYCTDLKNKGNAYASEEYRLLIEKIPPILDFHEKLLAELKEIAKPKTTTTPKPTTTTTPKPTTTVTSAPSECENYHSFDQDDRNEYSSEEGWFCDSSDKHTSKDWHGEGWYRFTGKAGKQMADSAPCNWCCGTGGTGWLNGDHPSVHDGIVERQVCFSYEDSDDHYDKCTWKTTANVRNCGDFYVYQLQETPECVLRYCGKGI